MGLLGFGKLSLARKCQILFGAAVLSCLAVALIVPAIQMQNLSVDRYLRIAKETATLTVVATDLSPLDWQPAQEALARDWPRLCRYGEGEFPTVPPRLLSAAALEARETLGGGGFIRDAVRLLKANPQQIYTFRIADDEHGHSVVRLAMAVRASEAEQNPGDLRGVIEVQVPIRPESALINAAVLASALAFGALMALLVFYLVTQRILLSPVRKLRRLAEQVTRGDMDARSTIVTGDEYEDLGRAFNDMLGHLQDSQEALQKINRSLDTRLGELAETNVALFESNRIKSEFIANVSHELRTPLVSIIGFAELLTEADLANISTVGRLHRYANNILTSGRMLLEIINDLLDLAKIEAGKLELHIARVDLPQLGSDLFDFLTPLADKKKLVFTLNAPEDLPPMSSDAGRIKQILYNLLSNAIKFTPDEGEVTLNIRRSGSDAVAFEVIDSGPGIPPDLQEVIFEKFRQADASMTREFSGTGLGLAITRDLAVMLGGSVMLTSEVDKGSRFVVTLPLEAPRDAKLPLVNLT